MRPEPIPVRDSALKHGIDPEDTRYAYRHAWRTVPFGPGDPEQELAIGPDRRGNPLEVLANHPGTSRVVLVHSDKLRKVFHKYLR